MSSSTSTLFMDQLLPLLNNVLASKPEMKQTIMVKSIPVDVVEETNVIMLVAELPGVSKSNIKLSSTDQVLTITANKNSLWSSDMNRIKHYTECSYGTIERVINMPKNCNMNPITKIFEHGILILTFNVIPPSESKSIEL